MEILSKFWNRLLNITELIIGGGIKLEVGLENFEKLIIEGGGGDDYSVLKSMYSIIYCWSYKPNIVKNIPVPI